MPETTTIQNWKLDKGIAPTKAGQIAAYRAEQAEKSTEDTD